MKTRLILDSGRNMSQTCVQYFLAVLCLFIGKKADIAFFKKELLDFLDALLPDVADIQQTVFDCENFLERSKCVDAGVICRTLPPQKQRKNLRNPKISKVFGGDKRDRTADLLNAMSAIREQNEFQCIL